MTLDAEGLHADKPNAITTVSGLKVEPLAMTPADVSIDDIAHALAHQCRYNGHCWGHLSVARHSLWVADFVAERTNSPQLELAGLLHDASEAYLGDLVRPLKHSEELAAFGIAEERLDKVIAEVFLIPNPLPEVVHAGDRHVLIEIELAHPDGARFTWDSSWRSDYFDFIDRYHEIRSAL